MMKISTIWAGLSQIFSTGFLFIYQYILICLFFELAQMKCCVKMDMQSFSDVLSLIAQPNRLQIICLLGKKGELCVCEIMEKLGLKQNLVSHHLGILKDIGLLIARREGKNIFYKLDAKYFAMLQKEIQRIFNF